MSPMDAADRAFAGLSMRSRPLQFYGSALASGLPHRLISAGQLKGLLLARETPYGVRNDAWRGLLERSRAQGGDWTVAAVGIALPMLRRVGRHLAGVYEGDPWELDLAILGGFLAGAAGIDTGTGRIVHRLRWAAYRTGRRLLDQQRDEQMANRGRFESSVPHPPWGHPDLVLVRAVDAGVITAGEADLISSTRLDGMDLTTAATALGIGYSAVAQRRHRAERRLVAALVAGDLIGDSTSPITHGHREGWVAVSRTGAGTGLQERGDRPDRPATPAVPDPSEVAMTTRMTPPTRPPNTPPTPRWRLRHSNPAARRAAATTALAVLLVLVVPAVARADTVVLAQATSVDQVLTNIRNWLMGILALLATVIATIGGVRRVLAGGDPGEIEASNRCFKSAAWGFGLAALAPLAVEVLRGIVGL